MSITHVAGVDITKDGHYVRQRCSWCGAVLVDQDAAHVARPVADITGDETPAQFVGTWAVGALVRVDAGVKYVLDDDERYPDDSCLALDPAATA